MQHALSSKKITTKKIYLLRQDHCLHHQETAAYQRTEGACLSPGGRQGRAARQVVT